MARSLTAARGPSFGTALGLVALLAAGCVPVTEPLGDVDKAKPDKALIGTWKVTKSSGPLFPLFAFKTLEADAPKVKGKPKGLMRAGTDSGSVPELWFFTTALGKHTYATAFVGSGADDPSFGKKGEYKKWADGDKKRYFVFRYKLDGDDLTLDAGNYDAFSKVARDANLGDDGAKHFSYFSTPTGWLEKHYTKNGSDAIYDGTNALVMKRDKK